MGSLQGEHLERWGVDGYLNIAYVSMYRLHHFGYWLQ